MSLKKPNSAQHGDRGNEPQGPSDKPEPDRSPEALRRNRLGSVFLGLVIISFIVTLYPLPFKLLSGVVAIAGVLWGVRLIRASLKTRQASSWVATGVIGVLCCAYSIFGSVSTAVIFPIQRQYEECTVSAITEQAAVSCTSDYQKSLQDMLNRLSGSAS